MYSCWICKRAERAITRSPPAPAVTKLHSLGAALIKNLIHQQQHQPTNEAPLQKRSSARPAVCAMENDIHTWWKDRRMWNASSVGKMVLLKLSAHQPPPPFNIQNTMQIWWCGTRIQEEKPRLNWRWGGWGDSERIMIKRKDTQPTNRINKQMTIGNKRLINTQILCLFHKLTVDYMQGSAAELWQVPTWWFVTCTRPLLNLVLWGSPSNRINLLLPVPTSPPSLMHSNNRAPSRGREESSSLQCL